MVDSISPVTGTGSIVGFAHNDHDRGHHPFGCGVSDKDQGYAGLVDASERTRDVLHGQRFSDKSNSDGHWSNQVAIEKVGAAAVISNERIGTVLQVQAERLSADQYAQNERINLANTLALSDMRLEQQKQACEMEAKLAACCCKLEARILEVESNRVRDDLAQARAELIALKAAV